MIHEEASYIKCIPLMNRRLTSFFMTSRVCSHSCSPSVATWSRCSACLSLRMALSFSRSRRDCSSRAEASSLFMWRRFSLSVALSAHRRRHRSINQSINQSISQSVSQLINQSINPSIERLVDHFISSNMTHIKHRERERIDRMENGARSPLIRSTLSFHFNGHFSRWTWVSRYQNVSILDVIEAIADGGDKWSHRMRKAADKSSPSENQHPL